MFFLKIEGLKKKPWQHSFYWDVMNSACDVSFSRWRERGLPFWSGSRQVNENGPYSKFRTGKLFIFGSKSLIGRGFGSSSCMCCTDWWLFSEWQMIIQLLPKLQYTTEHTVCVWYCIFGQPKPNTILTHPSCQLFYLMTQIWIQNEQLYFWWIISIIVAYFVPIVPIDSQNLLVCVLWLICNMCYVNSTWYMLHILQYIYIYIVCVYITRTHIAYV